MTDTHFFDKIDDEMKAYWLGFLHADGHIFKNRYSVSVNLSRRDGDHLRKLHRLIGGTISESEHFDTRTHKTYYRTTLVLYGKCLCERLRQIGIKTDGDEVYSNIPPELHHHFIRGYFDGDGCVGWRGRGNRRSFYIDLAGTEAFLISTQSLLRMRLGLRRNKITNGTGICRMGWSGAFSIARVKRWFYDGASVFLERKATKFDEAPKQRGSSQYQGVYWQKRGNKWVARLYYDGKTQHIGCFDDEEAAARAYDIKTIEIYGESASVNFPQ